MGQWKKLKNFNNSKSGTMDKHIWVGQWMDSHIFQESKEMVQYLNFKMLHNMYEPSQGNWIIWKSVKMNKIMDENEENEEKYPTNFIFHPSFNLTKSNNFFFTQVVIWRSGLLMKLNKW